MDIITLWSRIILPLTILIFVIYVIISSNKAAKELEQKKSEANNQIDASVNNKDSLPPFRDNVEAFLPETELAHQTAETTKAEIPTKSVPVTSLIDLSPETFRQGIILAEILGRPKGLRHRT
jgi:hypothetical protein